jgi:hypothetical protein
LVQLAAHDATMPHREARNADRSRRTRASDFRMPGAPFTWTKAGLELEIGFGEFEHLAAPFSPSRQVSRSVGTSDLSPGERPNSGEERDSLITVKSSLIARFNSL